MKKSVKERREASFCASRVGEAWGKAHCGGDLGWVPLWMPGGELAPLLLGLPCLGHGMFLAVNPGWSDLITTW